MVIIADKAFRTIKQTIRTLVPRRSPRPLADVIIEVNAALRGWTYYFRHAIAGRRFSFLRYLTWRPIATADAALFDPTKVRIERYRSRGTRIPSPYDPATTAA